MVNPRPTYTPGTKGFYDGHAVVVVRMVSSDMVEYRSTTGTWRGFATDFYPANELIRGVSTCDNCGGLTKDYTNDGAGLTRDRGAKTDRPFRWGVTCPCGTRRGKPIWTS